MILDAELIFDEAADLTSAVTTASIDMGQQYPDLGMLKELYLVVIPREDVAGTSLSVALQDSDDDETFTTVLQTGAIPVEYFDQDVAIPMPVAHRRYVRAVVTPTSITAGTAAIAIADNFDKKAWLYRDTVEFFEPDPDAMKINLETAVKGVLPIENGGTGTSTASGNDSGG